MKWTRWRSLGRFTKMRAIVKSNIDPEDVETVRGLYNAIHRDPGKRLHDDAMQRLDSLGEDNLE